MDVPIDVWDIDTFDQELRSLLGAQAAPVRDYLLTDRQHFLERQASKARGPYAINPHAGIYYWFVEHVVMPAMEARSIRAWHYTRLTDDEVDLIQSSGVHVSTLETIRRRLDAQVLRGLLSQQHADALFAGSPFHCDESFGKRSGMFWMTSHPLPPGYGGVEPLLASWGGESIYFSLRDPGLRDLVMSIGQPRVIEVGVTLSATRHVHSAAKAVVATFARTLGCQPDGEVFDLYATSNLGPRSVIAIHTEGEPKFAALTREYPVRYRQAVGANEA